jgi:hypothetical protein
VVGALHHGVFVCFVQGKVLLESNSLFGWLAASQPAVFFSYINLALVNNSIFLSQQISTNRQPLASRTRSKSNTAHL